MPNKIVGSLALTSFDSIFGNSPIDGEHITYIPLAELHPPEFHPFSVLDDESMTRLTRSVEQYGVREPGLARPREDGGYELIAGNRRRRACELAGIATMPVIIREMDDDSAAIAMVDSNLEQREKLLFSERAWAYRVKMEALNHRGLKSDIPGQLSVEILCQQTGESKNTFYRLIRLTELVPDLLDKVDTKKLGFNPAVELSNLTRLEQAAIAEAMAKHEVKPSLSQAVRLRKLSQSGELTAGAIDALLAESKKPPKAEQYGATGYTRFFPREYSYQQMDKVITSLLRVWQSERSALS